MCFTTEEAPGTAASILGAGVVEKVLDFGCVARIIAISQFMPLDKSVPLAKLFPRL